MGTVSSAFRSQLDALLTTLNQTDPHFIRCIVPNNHKTPGLLDSALVMHQLTCNGVLEGIRICRRGFPNRTVYPDFVHRFIIIKPKEVHECGADLKQGTKVILESSKEMIPIMQRNMKKYLFFRDWTWYALLNGTKRFIGQVDMDGIIRGLEEEAAEAYG